jgi:hypothetical protein
VEFKRTGPHTCPMRLGAKAILLFLATGAAGCLGGASEPASITSGDPPASLTSSTGGNGTLRDFDNLTPAPAIQPQGISFGGGPCIGASVLLSVDITAAQAALPEGFRAADGPVYTGPVYVPPPVPTGKGLVAVEVVFCYGAQYTGGGPLGLASVSVHVHAPDAGADLPDVDFDFYEVSSYATDANLTNLLKVVGYDVPLAGVAATKFVVPVGPATGRATVTEAGQEVIMVEPTAAFPQRFHTWTRRVWHETDEGLLRIDYRLETTRHHGIAQCRFATPIFGQSQCPADGQWEALVWDESSWEARLFFTPAAG